MPYIKSTRLSQPQGRAEIDWTNPITNSLKGVILPAITNEIINGIYATVGTNDIRTVTASVGLGVKGLTSGVLVGWAYIGEWSRIAGDLTILVVEQLWAIPSQSTRSAGNFQGGGSQGGYILAPNGSNFRLFYIGADGVQVNVIGAPVDLKLHVNVGVVTSSTLYLYNDGVVYTSSAPGFGAASSIDFTILGDNGTVGNGMPAPSTIFATYVWNRALSKQEVLSISANPWQLFK